MTINQSLTLTVEYLIETVIKKSLLSFIKSLTHQKQNKPTEGQRKAKAGKLMYL